MQPGLLEPIMKVEVTVPEEYMGDVMGDLNSRRGRIEGMDSRGGAQVIRAKVPLGRNVRIFHDASLEDARPRSILDGNFPL